MIRIADAKENFSKRNGWKAMDNFRIAKELIEIAKDIRIGKIIKAWATTDLKKLILRVDQSITRYLKKYDVKCKIHDVGFVVHHFNWGNNKKIITTNVTENQIKELRKAIQLKEQTGEENQLYKDFKKEISHIVLLPTWFHNYYHCNEGKPGWENLNTREAYYKKMAQCLYNEESYDLIKDLRFNPSTIYSAAKSIEILALTAHKENKKKVMSYLEKAYYELKNLIIEYFKTHKY